MIGLQRFDMVEKFDQPPDWIRVGAAAWLTSDDGEKEIPVVVGVDGTARRSGSLVWAVVVTGPDGEAIVPPSALRPRRGIDGRWILSTDEERWDIPEEGFETIDEAVAAASEYALEFESRTVWVGKARELIPERCVEQHAVESFLETLEDSLFDDWGGGEDPLLDGINAGDLHRAIVLELKRQNQPRGWYTLDDVVQIDVDLACRVCGCTDQHPAFDSSGARVLWSEANLCSACDQAVKS